MGEAAGEHEDLVHDAVRVTHGAAGEGQGGHVVRTGGALGDDLEQQASAAFT